MKLNELIPETLDEVFIVQGDRDYELLREGKWVPGRFPTSLRIDQPTHGVGQPHAHVHGRKGDQLGVVNFDGTASHGTKMRLHPKDAAALRARGFNIPADNLVEWLLLQGQSAQLLLG